MAISIGNSGFEYTKGAKEIIGGSKKHGRHYGTKCTVINSKTGVSIFSIMGGIRYNPYGNPFTGSRKFLGMDNKYYYIQIGSNSNVDYGQIQSNGAVLRSNRTILKILAFYPVYNDPPVPEPKIQPVKPPVVTISPAPKTIIKEESLWHENLITQINRIINQIKKIIRSILKI